MQNKKQVHRSRTPKQANLTALKVVDYKDAYDGKYLKPGVYGIISRDTPFIYKNVIDRKTQKPKPKFLNDMNVLTNVCKQEIITFFNDDKNKRKSKCYLMDK